VKLHAKNEICQGTCSEWLYSGQELSSACSFPLLPWDLTEACTASFLSWMELNFLGCSGEQSSILVSWARARMRLVCASGMLQCEMPSAPLDQMMLFSLLDALTYLKVAVPDYCAISFSTSSKEMPSEVWNHPLHHCSWLSLKSVFFWPTRNGKQRSVTF